MRGRTCGELTCEIPVREQGTDLGSFAADLGLLENIPSFGIDQFEEGWAREIVQGQFASCLTHNPPPCLRGLWPFRVGRAQPRRGPRDRRRAGPRTLG